MSTGVFNAGIASNDVGYYAGTYIYHTYPFFGFGRNTINTLRAWVRFVDISIPDNARIESAFIRVKSVWTTSSATCNVNLCFYDADNPPSDIYTSSTFNALPVTGSVPWDGVEAFIDGSYYDSPDISGILQQIINRPGWASGNALYLKLLDNASSDGAFRQADEVDVQLFVEWSTPEINEEATVSDVFNDNQGELSGSVSANDTFSVDHSEPLHGILDEFAIATAQLDANHDGLDEQVYASDLFEWHSPVFTFDITENGRAHDSTDCQNQIEIDESVSVNADLDTLMDGLSESVSANDLFAFVYDLDISEDVSAAEDLSPLFVLPISEQVDILGTLIADLISISSVSDRLSVWDATDTELALRLIETMALTDSTKFELVLLLTDYIRAVDALSGQQTGTISVSDTLHAYDSNVEWLKIISATITEAIAIADAPTAILTVLLTDYMMARDAVSHNLTGTKALSEIITATDTVVAEWLLSLVESLAITDALSNLRENTLSVSESVSLSDILTGLGFFGVTIQDAAGISDIARTVIELLISESLVATDSPSYFKDVYLSLADTLGAADALTASLNVYLSLTDNLVAVDTASNTGVFGVTITEGIKIDVSVEIDGEIFECYVLSTPKFLPSIYSGFNFNSYCEFRGRAFGANATGIFELTGDTDNGTTIHSGATLHETDFGARNDKRFRKAYLGVSGADPVMIMETGEGERIVYAIDDKGKVGASRSLHSRDWKLSIAEFDAVDSVHLVPVILARGK